MENAAAAAKSLQSCLTLCDPIDRSPPGSAIPGILQARTLEWIAVSFSNAWKWRVKMKSLSRVRLLATPWNAAYQAPPSMGFSRQEYWSGLPLPSPTPLINTDNDFHIKKGNISKFKIINLTLQFSLSVMSDSLQHHGLQHARPSCPSPTPRTYSNPCLLSQWCHPTISSSVIPFFSCLQSFSASGSFQMCSLHEVAKVLELQL